MPPERERSAEAMRKFRIFGILAVLGLGSLVVTGIKARESGHNRLAAWTEEQAVPTVATILPSAGTSTITLALPGRMEAYARAPIFGR